MCCLSQDEEITSNVFKVDESALATLLGINISLWIYLIAEIQLRIKVSLRISFKAERMVTADLLGMKIPLRVSSKGEIHWT